METPLLIKSFTSENDYLPVESLKDVKHVLWSEAMKIWKIALPVALCSLFQYLTNTSTSIYAGHLGDVELSSFSLYQSILNCIYSLLVSLYFPHHNSYSSKNLYLELKPTFRYFSTF